MEMELLNPNRLRYWCSVIDLPEGAIDALAEMAARVNAEPVLAEVFAAFYEKHVVRGEWKRDWHPFPFDPAIEGACGEDASLFYLLAHLAGLPKAWAQYEKLGIGIDIFKMTMLDFKLYAQDYFDGHGRWGFAIFPWVWRHLSAELFRLGRLQYMLIPFPGGITGFRRKSDGAYLLAADPGVPLRADGYAWGAGRASGTELPPEDRETWRPIFEKGSEGWKVNVVSARGQVQRRPVLLSSAEWEIMLQSGDTVLDTHIPRKNSFTVDDCKESYSMAVRFFRQTFPDRLHKALFCHTWMFAPQLSEVLPERSNVLGFQREFYLYPFPGTADNVWRFVFGDIYADVAAAPRDTSLRRELADWFAKGGEAFELPGVMFHGPGQWGTQPHLAQALPTVTSGL